MNRQCLICQRIRAGTCRLVSIFIRLKIVPILTMRSLSLALMAPQDSQLVLQEAALRVALVQLAMLFYRHLRQSVVHDHCHQGARW